MIEFNKDIKLQIIFISDPDQEYYTHTPVDYFLTLYYDGANMEDIFSKWYKKKYRISLYLERFTESMTNILHRIITMPSKWHISVSIIE